MKGFGHGSLKLDIDIGLAVLRAVCPGEAMSVKAIADVCGVHHRAISDIEKRAFRKFRARLREMTNGEIHHVY